MHLLNSMLACGSMNIGLGDAMEIFAVIGLWLIGFLACLSNLFLSITNGTGFFKIANLGVMIGYCLSIFLLRSPHFTFLWIGIPSMPILHFIYLIRIYNSSKGALENSVLDQ